MNQFASSSLTIGQVNALVKKLGGVEAVLKILRDDAECTRSSMTVTLGNIRGAENFRRALSDADCLIGDTANSLLDRPEFMLSCEDREVDTVIVSVRDLGFDGGAMRGDIYLRIAELGLFLFLGDGGPQIRLRYRSQARGERLLVGLQPLRDASGQYRIFCVDRNENGARYLGAVNASLDYVWPANTLWIFHRNKRS